jgi:hypothetical protein
LGNILSTTYNTFRVLETLISINGEHIIVALKCPFGKLNEGSVLSSKGKLWQIIDNDLKFSTKELENRLREKEEESIFLYDLKGLGHTNKPMIGQELTLEQNVS